MKLRKSLFAICCLLVSEFHLGYVLTSQCVDLPTDDSLPMFEPRKYTFAPTDGVKAFQSCTWTFRSSNNSSIMLFVSVIKTGPSSTLNIYDDDRLLRSYHSQNKYTGSHSLITTSTNKVRLEFYSGFASIPGTGFEIEMMALSPQSVSVEDNKFLDAAREQRFLASPRFPVRPKFGRSMKWTLEATDCSSGIQIAILFIDAAKDYRKNECIDSLVFQTDNERISFCMEKTFRPPNGYFYFHTTKLEVTYDPHPGNDHIGFVLKYRSNYLSRLRPEELMNIYTKIDKDPDGFDSRYINFDTGRGVFATWPFEENDFLMDFSKVPFTPEEPSSFTYVFSAEINNTVMWVNAEKDDGTFGRLLNDNTFDPNAEAPMVIDYENKPHICYYAIKKIDIGDEITFNYGKGDFPWRTEVQATVIL